MRFSCPKCQKKYAIADEKLPADRAVRFTCKACNHIMRLRKNSEDSDGQVESIEDKTSEGADAAPAVWFAMLGGQQKGPLSEADLLNHAQSGGLHKSSYIWKEGMADWKALKDIPELRSISDKAAETPANPFDVANAGLDASQQQYLERPAGEQTRLFMNTAGIFKRRRRQKIAAVSAGIFVLTLAAFLYLDAKGMVWIPGMGYAYELSGREDPNAERGYDVVAKKLEQEAELTEEERKKLEERLSKYESRLNRPQKPRVASLERRATQQPKFQEAVQDTKEQDEKTRNFAASVFSDSRKKESTLKLASPEKLEVPNLPKGLTPEAIYKVLGNNMPSLSNCATQAQKAGESLNGRMDVEWTIQPNGRVLEVRVLSPRKRNTSLGKCTARAIGRWRFPAFNGQPVPVRFPLILGSSY